MSNVVSEHDAHPLSLGKYIFGFVGSVIITMAAYVVVKEGEFSRNVIIAIISLLAVMQFFLQMVFFLHVGDEHRPYWKQLMLWFMLGIVLIVVVGSIWIMNNLDYRMMPDQMNDYLKSQDGF